ncbi:MAG: YjiH family protein [Defluviitaleaceae bacterium]|nr:YjiH family protein [Defluviitaleaceae bacterium]
MNQELKDYTPKLAHKLKFIIMSLVGVFLFMVPIPFTNADGYRAFNIPLGFAIAWLGETINALDVNGFGLLFFVAAGVITISFLGSAIAYIIKMIAYSILLATSAEEPAAALNARIEKLGPVIKLFLCSPLYFVSKAIAVAIVWMVFLGMGPDWLIASFTGDLMMDLISAGGSNLMSIFIILGITIPLLTDFGLMEFLGTLIRKVIRFLFTLPGRSSIDLLGSWFSSSAASVIITRQQHEKGFYTDREAAAICVNFTLVSLPFTFVIASTVGLMGHFPLFYLVITVTTILLAILMPRIWPLSRIKNEYLPDVGKQIDEEVPKGTSMFSWAVKSASRRAGQTGPNDVMKSGASNWLNIFMDLIPVILAWGTIALVLVEFTDIFDVLAWPFGWYMNILGVEGAFDYAPATIVGFIDMFIPAILLGTEAPLATRFIIGALSIVQIIYLAETGILILKSRIPLNIGHLAILFVMRTIIALPIIVLFAWLFL